MPLLPPIEGLHFHPEAHRYRYRDTWLPYSVTQIVSDLDDKARKRIEETRHVWAPRGNAVHAALEQHLLGEAEVNPGGYQDWVGSLLDCWLWKDAEVLAAEYRLVDPKKLVGGSTDFILRTAKASLVVGDLKTVSSAPAAKSRKTADAQLGAYISMLAVHHPHLTVQKAVTVVSGPGVCEVKTSEPDKCVALWEDAWLRYQTEQDLLLGF